MKLRLVYFHRLEFSGSSQTIQVLRDYHAMLAWGHEVDLIYRAAQPLTDAELHGWLERHGLSPSPQLRFHCVNEGWRGKSRLQALAASWVEASHSPVVLATRTLDHARRALRLRQRFGPQRVGVVLELHETAIPHLVYRECGRRWRAAISRWRERHVFSKVNALVATVGSQVELLESLYPAHARIAVLPNGVDLTAYDATVRTDGMPNRQIRLRYAGQFLAWKNTEAMFAALALLPASVVLELAGGKPGSESQTRQAIETMAARHGVGARVTYRGFLSPRDVPNFLVNADVLLLPLGDNVQSRYFTCPMKLFEYAAARVPMVVARQPTTQSLIEEGREALMFTANSANELAQAVARLVEEPALGSRLARQARAWVVAYSYPERARRYHQFLVDTMTPTETLSK